MMLWLFSSNAANGHRSVVPICWMLHLDPEVTLQKAGKCFCPLTVPTATGLLKNEVPNTGTPPGSWDIPNAKEPLEFAVVDEPPPVVATVLVVAEDPWPVRDVVVVLEPHPERPITQASAMTDTMSTLSRLDRAPHACDEATVSSLPTMVNRSPSTTRSARPAEAHAVPPPNAAAISRGRD